jgi:hypothetical protein
MAERKPTKSDAVKFLELMVGECTSGTSEHSWRKCPRCLAIAQLQDRDPLALRLVAQAIEELKR